MDGGSGVSIEQELRTASMDGNGAGPSSHLSWSWVGIENCWVLWLVIWVFCGAYGDYGREANVPLCLLLCCCSSFSAPSPHEQTRLIPLRAWSHRAPTQGQCQQPPPPVSSTFSCPVPSVLPPAPLSEYPVRSFVLSYFHWGISVWKMFVLSQQDLHFYRSTKDSKEFVCTRDISDSMGACETFLPPGQWPITFCNYKSGNLSSLVIGLLLEGSWADFLPPLKLKLRILDVAPHIFW